MTSSSRGSAGLAAERAQLCLRNLDHLLVDLEQGHGLDCQVLQDFLQGAAVTAADNQDLLDLAVREDRQVDGHLVIEARVPFCRLNHAVEGQWPAEHTVLEHLYALERFGLEEDLVLVQLNPPSSVVCDVDLFRPPSLCASPRRTL
jgi:hypothetical protein